MTAFGTNHRLGRDGRRAYLDDSGASIGAGVPLLLRDDYGRWRVRPQDDLQKLFVIALGAPIDLSWRMIKLATVARALNAGDRSLAAIALVQAELPILPDEISACRMANADAIAKSTFNPNEPRDDNGQWTNEGAPNMTPTDTSSRLGALEPVTTKRPA